LINGNDTGYWMLDGAERKSRFLREYRLPITGCGDDQVSLSSIQHQASSIQYLIIFLHGLAA
jgi:hypothetical protein